MDKLLQINSKDNVAINLDNNSSIKVGHKVATKDILKGEYIIKYGVIIARAKSDIKKGEWVHSHNIESHLDENVTYEYNPLTYQKTSKSGTFLGFKREKGRAGIRNDIYIIPTVGCVNGVAKEIEKASQEFVKGSINSIFHLPHQFGCSQLGDDQNNIQRLLVSIALNPNATYVLFIGLGCENNSLQGIKDLLKPYERNNIYFYNAQDVEDEVSYGVNIIKELADKASKLQREEVDIKELCIGLKCGGSDAFSGITANPLVGQISDEIISCGGSAILTEVPEMFGAEQILMNRCESEEIFNKYRDLIVNFKNYYLDLGFPVYENPSPGNKEGGITTLEEKSCGCITKAGESLIVDVLNYGEIIKKDGLNVLNGPGNDLIAATALAASGCQLILFTTGRGTPFSTIVPTLKIATNSLLANRKNNWIDFDASTMDKEGLFNLVISTASGTYKAKQEDNHEIAFFKKGVTL
jgi:altronate hydrolase